MQTSASEPVRVRIELVTRGEPTDPDGLPPLPQVVVIPERFRVRPGEPLVFECEHPFGVRFMGRDPLSGELRYFREPRESGAESPPFPLRTDPDLHYLWQYVRADAARTDVYEYAVAVHAGDRVHIIDPDGVVDPDPSGRGFE